MRSLERLGLYIVVFLSSLGLLLYSFTQIDLGLTISRIGVIQNLVRWFQHIGYFSRPLSTGIYASLLILWFSLYARLLFLTYRGKATFRFVVTLICIIVCVSFFSYPAFSYDFFNYMFTAKTVAFYHKNPYTVIPLDFTGFDPWIHFMRWTHLPSAYTPLWIIFTVPLYLLSFGVFLPFVFILKGVFSLSYIFSCFAIYFIAKKEKIMRPELALTAFALNPLVIIESLISPHNDSVMMALVLFSYVLFLKKRLWGSLFLLASSVGLKFMTIFLLPAYIFRWNRILSLLGMFVGFLLVLTQREVLPWYFLWLIPFAALLSMYPEILILLFGASLGLLLRYVPYLYLGNWDPPALQWKSLLTAFPLLVSLIFSFGIMLRNIRNRA